MPRVQKNTQVSIKGVSTSVNIKINYSPQFSFKYDSVYLLKQDRIKIEPLIKLAPSQNLIRSTPSIRVNQSYKLNKPIIIQQIKPDSQTLIKSREPAPRGNPLPDPVLTDLINEKIILESVVTNKEDLSYTLNNEALIVQGVKQAEALFQKLRSKYIGPTGRTTRFYSWKN